MLAVQPYSPVTRKHGASVRRSETTTFSILSPRISFISLHSGSKSALSSSKAFFRPRTRQSEALLGDRDELLAVVLLELLHAVLVDRVDHEEHLEVALLAALNEGRRLDRLLRLAGDVEDVLLALGHARHVVLERRLLVAPH